MKTDIVYGIRDLPDHHPRGWWSSTFAKCFPSANDQLDRILDDGVYETMDRVREAMREAIIDGTNKARS